MVNISNNGIVTMNKGDTFKFPLLINVGDMFTPIRYELTENDKVYFALLEPNQPFEEALIRQVYTYEDVNEDGDIVIKLNSKDTSDLLPGLYYYTIKLQTMPENEEIVNTIIPRRKFILLD